MKPVILTAAEMRAAEEETIAAGSSVDLLMERAGFAAAEAIWRFAGPIRALILCGPGNNGGDGYVVARALRDRGVEVTVAASAEPNSEAAQRARKSWVGETCSLDSARPAPLLIDALFGTGLTRALDAAVAGRLCELASEARVKVAIDLPSGVATDDGAILSPVPDFDLTVAFQTLKPAHLLQPAARHMGRIVVADIGIQARSNLELIRRPKLTPPGPDDHKYSRGFVALVAGDMPGAAALAASVALRSGAGYVSLAAPSFVAGVPSAVVQASRSADDLLADERVGAAVIGPGLGRGEAAAEFLDRALGSTRPLVLDADALVLLAKRGIGALRRLAQPAILTPHQGEFGRLFPSAHGSKLEQARAAAEASKAVIVFKGADTIVAAPDGRAAMARPAPAWLATAGTGDVLTGIVAALRARGMEAFDAACAAVWIHGRSAEHSGPLLIADDLVDHVAEAVRETL